MSYAFETLAGEKGAFPTNVSCMVVALAGREASTSSLPQRRTVQEVLEGISFFLDYGDPQVIAVIATTIDREAQRSSHAVTDIIDRRAEG